MDRAAPTERPRMGSREDRRLNLKVGLGLLLLLAALALFAYRPAALLGVSGDALAKSLVTEGKGSCVETADSEWECVIVTNLPSGGSHLTFYVETRGWGCWDAYANPARDRGGSSGCVTFFDML